MHSGFFTRLGVWLFAALIAWAATLWASGELEDSLQVMRVQLRQYVTFESPRAHRRVGVLEELDTSFHEADTTAVVLNWSRFSNVLEIASTLCSPSLERVIAEVFIWNNNPSPISYDVRPFSSILLQRGANHAVPTCCLGLCRHRLFAVKAQDP